MADKIGYNYTHIAAAGTYTLISGSPGPNSAPASMGLLVSILYNAAVTSVTIYDGTVAQNVVVGIPGAANPGTLFPLNIQLKNGLTLVVVGASADITVCWA